MEYIQMPHFEKYFILKFSKFNLQTLQVFCTNHLYASNTAHIVLIIVGTVATSVLSQKFESIAMIFNCSGATITLCGASERVICLPACLIILQIVDKLDGLNLF